MSAADLLRAVAKVVNNDDQAALAELIEKSDFSGNQFAQEAVVRGFSLVDQNIDLHKKAAKKILSFDSQDGWGISAAIRFEVLSLKMEKFA